jgi:hypothetical protein
MVCVLYRERPERRHREEINMATKTKRNRAVVLPRSCSALGIAIEFATSGLSTGGERTQATLQILAAEVLKLRKKLRAMKRVKPEVIYVDPLYLP